VCFEGSIIICGFVCCASVQSGYNHSLSLFFICIPIYPSHVLSLMGSESLYRVKRQQCVPQTSIDGEEPEVRLSFLNIEYSTDFFFYNTVLWLFLVPFPPEEMSNTSAGAGGSWGEHTGHGGRRARCKVCRCKHPVLSVGKSISSSFPSCSSACRHQVGAVPSYMRRGLLPCVQV